MTSTAPEKSAGAFSGRAASPRPLPAAWRDRAPARWWRSAPAIPARQALPRPFPAPASSTAMMRCSTTPEVDAVYIAIPHPGHAEWAIKAAEAGKHVLCEKPLALTAFEADAMIHAARKAGTFLGEAFMYRLHPQTLKLVELIKSGVIGEVRMIKSSFGFAMPGFMPEHRLYANDLAGGGILDVGGYPVSMARLIAGAAAGKPFAEPDKVAGAAHLGQSGVDEWASALLHFPGGIVAEVSCSISLNQDNVLRILGTKGRIEVPDFWFAGGNRDVGLGQDRPDPARRHTRNHQRQRNPPSLFLRGRCRRRRDPRRQPGIRLAGHGLGRQPRHAARARQMARGCRARIRDREAGKTHQHDLRPAAAHRWHQPSPSARSRVCRRPASVAGARLRGFPHLFLGLDPARRLLRGRRQSVRHRLCLRRRLYRDAARPVAEEPRRARAVGRSSARARIRRSAIPMSSASSSPSRSTGCRPTMSTSISCTATIPTCRSASSSTPWTRRSRPAASAVRSAARTGRWRAWTRRSPMPKGPASRSPARSPTISRWPRCWSRSGPAASPPRPTSGRPG